MKRFYALALGAVMALSLVACTAAKADDNATAEIAPTENVVTGGMSGGWAHASDPAVTDELRAVFDKALTDFVGSNIQPVAYLGSQVVAGMNHCFLCQSTVVVPDAEPHYVLVYIYEALDGSATLMNIADLDIGSFCEYGGAGISDNT